MGDVALRTRSAWHVSWRWRAGSYARSISRRGGCPRPSRGWRTASGSKVWWPADRERYVGRDVTHLFRHGSANPVRYLPLDALTEDAVIAPEPAPRFPPARAEQLPDRAVEPGLLERILPLLDAFENDLLWAQSRAGQELFHSNTIAWLLRNFPVPCAPLLDLLGGHAL